MGLIRVLDERTANQIAAGEVVERPASVVKELVENSLDAGASRVVVEVEGGGRELIRVTDDGSGMSPQDGRLALQRHATSKIRTAEDLLAVDTMGFRGEALPSIASVSRFELVTRLHGELSGYRLVVEGGTVRAEGEAGAPPGTRISVQDLFFNVPARLKYLKSTATEMGQIGDILTRLALANPQAAIRFHSGSSQVFASPGTGRVSDAIGSLLGRQLARELLPVDYADDTARIWGFVGRPAVARAGRNQQFFFVNRRAIRTLQVRFALEEAYAHLVPNGRYPVCVLFIEVEPGQVDVNVHPAKAEVRFAREREVRSAVYKAARQTLGAHLLIPGTTVSAEGEVSLPDREGERAAARRQVSFSPPGDTSPQAAEGPGAYLLPPGGVHGVLQQRLQGATEAAQHELWAPEHRLPEGGALIAQLRPLGQVHRSYIACDGPEGLYLVDQHAAHERIFFERFLEAARESITPTQPLLFPITLDLPPVALALWREHEPLFRESGFEAEPFGGGTLLIKGIPTGISEAHTARLITDFLDRLQEERLGPGASPLERRQRVLAAMAACKAAIKAKDALQPEQMGALLQDLARCETPATCPHGRPTVICVSTGELEKRFKR